MRKFKSFSSKTKNQEAYIELMRNDDIDMVIAVGPAGTGKTMLACYSAVEALKLGKVAKIVITRPVVSVDEEIGFLPGGLTSKMDPWTRPAFDALKEHYTQKEIDTMIEEGTIEIVPLGFMRGRTFKRAWIVADEMQNSTPMQMLMLATRIGEGSKMVITGDLNQSDRVGLNGLQEICNKMRHNVAHSCIRFVALQCEDVQRSRAAKAILDIYESTSPAGKKEDAVSEFGAAASFVEDKNIVEQDSSIRGLTTERSQVENSNILENSSESIIVEIVEESVPIDAEAPTKDNACTPKNSRRSPREEKEWININSDAALIPLNHLTRKYRGE
jgi:phosphate starvation-inducible PhoH-like protein